MIWADRLVLGGLLIAMLYMFILNMTAPHIAPPSAYIELASVLGLKLGLPIWLALRVFDFIACGEIRTASRRPPDANFLG